MFPSKLILATLFLIVGPILLPSDAAGTSEVVCENPDDGTDGTGTIKSGLVWIQDRSCKPDGDCVAFTNAPSEYEDREIVSVFLLIGDFARPQLLAPLQYKVVDGKAEADVFWLSPDFDDSQVWVMYEHVDGCFLYSFAALSSDR